MRYEGKYRKTIKTIQLYVQLDEWHSAQRQGSGGTRENEIVRNGMILLSR